MIKYGWKEVGIMRSITVEDFGDLIDKENNIYFASNRCFKVFSKTPIYSYNFSRMFEPTLERYRWVFCRVERVKIESTENGNSFNKNINYKYPKQLKRLNKIGRNK